CGICVASVFVRPSPRLIHESALRSSVRDGPAEIHLDIDNLRVADGEDLGVPKSMTVGVASLIRHEDAVAIRHQVDELEARDSLAVWPAATAVRLAVETIVQRAGEMKIVSDDRLERCPVLGHIRVIGCPRDLRVTRRRLCGRLHDHDSSRRATSGRGDCDLSLTSEQLARGWDRGRDTKGEQAHADPTTARLAELL